MVTERGADRRLGSNILRVRCLIIVTFVESAKQIKSHDVNSRYEDVGDSKNMRTKFCLVKLDTMSMQRTAVDTSREGKVEQ